MKHFRLLIYASEHNHEFSGKIPDWLGDSRTGTALHMACRINYLDMIKWLLYFSGDPNSTKGQYSRSPLHYCRLPKIVRHLIKAGAHIDVIDRQGKAPLHLASERDDHALASA
jgi:ankyrin repeat protein